MKIKPQQPERKLFPEGNQRVILYGFLHTGKNKGREGWLPTDKYYFFFEGIDAEKQVFDSDKGEQRVSISRAVFGNKYYEFIEELIDRSLKKAEKDEGFDITTLIGKGFLISVEHIEKEGKQYANLRKIRSPLDDLGKPENASFAWSIYWNPQTKEPYSSQNEVLGCDRFSKLAEWMQKAIKESETFKALPD